MKLESGNGGISMSGTYMSMMNMGGMQMGMMSMGGMQMGMMSMGGTSMMGGTTMPAVQHGYHGVSYPTYNSPVQEEYYEDEYVEYVDGDYAEDGNVYYGEYVEDEYVEPTAMNSPVENAYVEPTVENSPVENEYEEPTGILLSIVSPDYARSKMHNLPWVEQQEIAKRLIDLAGGDDDALKYLNCHTMCQLWTMLGFVYLDGLGVEKDCRAADEYFHQAAVPEEMGGILDDDLTTTLPYPLPKGPAEPIAQYKHGCWLAAYALQHFEADGEIWSPHAQDCDNRARDLLRNAAAQGHEDAKWSIDKDDEAQEAQRYDEEMARYNEETARYNAEIQRRQAEEYRQDVEKQNRWQDECRRLRKYIPRIRRIKEQNAYYEILGQ